MKRSYAPLNFLASVVLAAAILPGAVVAQDGAWTANANGDWGIAGNWLTNGVAGGAGSTAWFTNNISANRIVAIDGPRTIGHMVIGDYSLGSVFTFTTNATGSLTFDNGASAATVTTIGPSFTINSPVVLNSDLIFTAQTNVNITLNGEVSGLNKGLTKSGPGRLLLTRPTSYTGATIVNGGVLRINRSDFINASSNLVLNGGILEFMTNSFSRPGGLGTGSNQIQIVGGVSGFTHISDGADRSVTIGTAGSELEWGSAYFNPSIFVLNSTGANRLVILDNAIDLNGADRQIDTVASVGRVNRPITNGAGTAAGLIKGGAGTLELTSSNSYDGTTTILNGALRLSTTPWSLSTNNTVVLNGGLLEFSVAHSYQNPMLGTGAGKVQFAGAAGFGAVNAVRPVNVNGTGETLKMGDGALAGWGSLLLNGLDAGSGHIVMMNGIDLNGSSRTVSVASGVGRILGPVTNTAGTVAQLEKTGGGTLLVIGDNYRHDGGTFIRAGILQLGDFFGGDGVLPGILGNAGSISNLGSIVVANTANMTLSGNIGGTGALFQRGWGGTLTLSGTNDYVGNTQLQRGTLVLDFSASGAPVNNIIGFGVSNSPLVLSDIGYTGGTLSMLGADGASNEQSFRQTTINAGASAISVQSGAGGTAYLLLSNLVRNTGGVIDFALPSSGAIRTTALLTNGILGGYATVDGTHWATLVGQDVVANSSYIEDFGAAVIADLPASNYRLTNLSSGDATLAAPTTTVYTLSMDDVTNRTIAVGAGNLLRLGRQGGILLAPGAGGLTIGSTPNDGFLTAGQTNHGPGELIFINNSTEAITVNSAIANNGTGMVSITKAGAGPAVFEGNMSIGNSNFFLEGAATLKGTNVLGRTYVTGGSLTFAAGSSNRMTQLLVINGGSVTIDAPLHSSSEVQIGSLAGGRGVLNINADLYTTRLRAALTDNMMSAGAIFHTAGTLFGSSDNNGLSVSDGTGNSGYYRISGGVLTGDTIVAYRGPGVFEQTGGFVTPDSRFQVVNNTGNGVANLFGGTFNAPGAAAESVIFQGTAYAGGTAVFNVLGGSLDGAYGSTGKAIDLMNQPGNTSYFNLLGGVVTANQIVASQTYGNSTLNLNGGTIVAAAGSTLSNSFISGLTAAYVYSGGGTVDVAGAGSKVTVQTGLQAPDGYGLASIATNENLGGQYIGAPVVRIAGGIGTGALAVAQVDFATGFITNLLVVNRGTGYGAADVLTVSLEGGGPLTAPTNFTVSGAALAANTSGGLTKTGNGMLILAGTNTFTGAIRVDSGLLDMAYAAPGATNITLGATAGMAFGVGGANTLTEPVIAGLLATKLAAGNSFGLDTSAGSHTWTTAIGGVADFYKFGNNTLILPTANTYSGATYVMGGALRAEWGTALPAASHMVLNGGAWETASGTANNWGAGGGQYEIPGGTSGFSAVTSPLTVNIGGAGALRTWGEAMFNPEALVLNAPTADADITLVNAVDLAGGTARTILVGAGTAYLAGGLTNTAFASGQGGLVKLGAGTLVLSNAAAMLNLQANPGLQVRQGTLLVTAGKIQSQQPANNSDYIGRFAGDDGTMILAGSGVFTRSNATLYVGTDAGSVGTFVVQDQATFWGNSQLYVGNSAGSTGLVQMTGGTLTLGANTVIGNSGVGRLILGGGILSNANTYIGNNATGPGTLIQSGGVFRASGTTIVADKVGSAGAYVQIGGTYSGAGQMQIANSPGSSGYFEMQGGTRTNAAWIQVGNQGIGLYYQSGGTNWVTGNGMLLNNGAGTNSAAGVAYVSGGVYTSGLPVILGYNIAPSTGGRAEFNVDGNGEVLLSSYVMMNRILAGSGLSSTNIINLDGGTLRATHVYKGATGGMSVINFDGGTLLAGANVSNASFIQGIDAAYIHDGGAFLDTATNTITVRQDLLAPAGSAVTALPWTGDKAGYVGAPYVKIAGGSGFGATAVALFDYTTGSVTGLALTGAGSGYAPGDVLTVTLTGGGTNDIVLGTATLGAAASGALTKSGSGTLVMTGNNTYTGGTVLAAGTLSVGSTTNLPLAGGLTFNGGVLMLTGTEFADLDDYAVNWGTFNGGIGVGEATHTLVVTNDIQGAGEFTKSGPGTLLFLGTNTYSGGTRIQNGKLVLNVDQGLGTGGLELGAVGTAGTLTLSNVSQTVNGTLWSRSSSLATNAIFIGAGQSLLVFGNVTNGVNVDHTSALAVGGPGTWAITNASGSFQSGIQSNGSSIVDMRDLGTFIADLGTGDFRIGPTNFANGTTTNLAWLATNSTIAAARIGLADTVQQTTGRTSLRLGPGATELRADNIFIGTGKQSTDVAFETASGTLTISNLAGTGRANLAVSVNWAGTGGSPVGIFDTRGHDVSLYLGSVTNGGRTSSLSGNNAGYIYFDTGVMDVQSMIVGIRSGTASGAMTGEVHIGGGTVNLGSVELARNSVAGGTATYGLLDLYGGTITMGGNIIRGGGVGPTTAALMMTNSATLDMNGFSIGDAVNPINALQLQSGTLKNVAEINGGAAWTKTGAGRLTLEGNNTFIGAVTVQTGVLAAASATALGTTAGGVTVLPGGTLGLQGGITVAGEAVILTGVGGVDGLQTAAGALRNISGANTWTGPITVTGSVDTALFSEEGHFTITGNITNNLTAGNLLLRGNGSGEIGGVISGARTLFKSAAGATNAGVWTLSGLNTYSGSTTVAAGTLRVSTEANLGTTPASYAVNQLILRGGLLQNTASMTISPTRGVQLGTLGGGFDTDAGTTQSVESIVSGVVGNPLVKTGAGTLHLIGANTYAGDTLVSNGTLRVNGTHSGGGMISVYAGATLAGTGTLAAVTVASGAALNPGNSAGTLTVGDLTLDGGVSLEYDLGTSSDLILAGATVLGGIEFANFTFIPGLGFGPGVYTLIDATGISGLGAGTTGTVGGLGASLSIDAGDQDLVLTVIPEPASLGLIGICAIAALLRRRLRV